MKSSISIPAQRRNPGWERGRRSLRDGVAVYVNGIGQSRLPFGPGIQTLLGALPAMIHPDPREAAVVGLGSGNTLAALAGRQPLQRNTSIEIVQPLIAVLRDSTRAIDYTGVDLLFSDPRIEHVAGDGRLFLRQAGRRFDIIEADALRPSSAYSGSLYSVEYFEILRAHLQPKGLAVTWSPTDRVAGTFAGVFPHAVQDGAVLLGSNEPILIDREAVSRRLADADTRRYYAAAGCRSHGHAHPVDLEPRRPRGAPGGRREHGSVPQRRIQRARRVRFFDAASGRVALAPRLPGAGLRRGDRYRGV
ncbi:MAG: hypothetical protein O3A25_12760 [Acidobacteria bacterium]|nr:hypothetical protein [Acidobacteriota bacterium]